MKRTELGLVKFDPARKCPACGEHRVKQLWNGQLVCYRPSCAAYGGPKREANTP